MIFCDLSQLERKRFLGQSLTACHRLMKGQVRDVRVKFVVKERTTEAIIDIDTDSELRAMMSRHPCILSLLGFCLPGTIITQYMKNGSLATVLDSVRHRRRPPCWTATNISKWIIELALGMRYLHSQGIIHRSLHLEALLLDDNFHLLIGCFEYSCFYRNRNDCMDKKQVGWGLYMAPELSGNGPHDEKVDVYSFGCIVYALLTSDPIFSDCSNRKFWKRLVNGWRPSIPCMVPVRLQSLIKRCWSEDPSNRPSFQEIVQELSNPSFEMFPGSNVNAVWRRMAFIQREEQQCGENLM